MTRTKPPKKPIAELDLATCKHVTGGATDDLWKYNRWESPVITAAGSGCAAAIDAERWLEAQAG